MATSPLAEEDSDNVADIGGYTHSVGHTPILHATMIAGQISHSAC
jgi:hypothetical protein